MADPKNYISQITLGATTYDLKDLEARADIADIKDALTGGVHTVGTTTTALTDGASTPTTIKISGEDYQVKTGDLVYYSNKEFLWNGQIWVELGDLTSLGDLAYKDTASATYTPAGSISVSTATTENKTATVAPAVSGDATYTPAGSVSQPTFTGSALTSTGKFTPAGSISVSAATTQNETATVAPAVSGEATYTPAGTVSQPTFEGSALTSTGSFTPEGSVSFTTTNAATTVAPAASGDATYTPAGSVAAPTISVSSAGTTDTVYSITDVGTLPVLTTNVSNEVLTISFSQGTLPTKGSAQTVKTGDASYEASAPSFTGTGVRLETGTITVPTSASFSGSAGNISVSGTPSGTVSQPTFSGTGVRLETGNIAVPATFSGTFTGTEGDLSVSGTPTGTVSQPTFTGTGVRLETGDIAVPATYTGSFTGTEATITVS